MVKEPAPFASLNGQIVPWGDAKIHIASPAVKYGTGVFEGIRGYWHEADQELYLFRVAEHLERLVYSQTVMGFADIVAPDRMQQEMLALLRHCAFKQNVHIRATVVLEGWGEFAATTPTGTAVIAIPRGSSPLMEVGLQAQISSWRRIPDDAMPMRVKAHANYNNGRYAALQAKRDGYDVPILLNMRGKLAEGPAMCCFLVRDGHILTPSLSNDLLESITRLTVIELCREMGLPVAEGDIDRSAVYAADEAFVCGTAWEVTPIVGFDRLVVGTGAPGPITQAIQKAYADVTIGRIDAHPEWRMAVFG